LWPVPRLQRLLGPFFGLPPALPEPAGSQPSAARRGSDGLGPWKDAKAELPACACMAALQRPFSGIPGFASRKAPRQLAGPPRPAGCLSFLESAGHFGLAHWAKLQAYAAWLSAIPGSCAAGGSCASWRKVPAPASCRATARPLLSLQRPLSPAGMLWRGPWRLRRLEIAWALSWRRMLAPLWPCKDGTAAASCKPPAAAE